MNSNNLLSSATTAPAPAADYCFGERKFGGNAQVGPAHMPNYAQLGQILNPEPLILHRSAAQPSSPPQAAARALHAAEHVLLPAEQAITRGRWLHHTTFLWDFDDAHMALLRHPGRAPAYREVGEIPWMRPPASAPACSQSGLGRVQAVRRVTVRA
jgi:hypothetical protein